MKTCPRCGAQNQDAAAFCCACALPLAAVALVQSYQSAPSYQYPPYAGAVAPPSPSPSVGAWKAKAQLPGILIAVLGFLSAALWLVLGALSTAESIMGRHFITPPNEPSQMLGVGLVMILGAIAHCFVGYAGIQFAHVRSRSLALAAAIMTVIPCMGCFLAGIPLGIYSLVLISRMPPDVWNVEAA